VEINALKWRWLRISVLTQLRDGDATRNYSAILILSFLATALPCSSTVAFGTIVRFTEQRQRRTKPFGNGSSSEIKVATV
jgi:hypothetical protein